MVDLAKDEFRETHRSEPLYVDIEYDAMSRGLNYLIETNRGTFFVSTSVDPLRFRRVTKKYVYETWRAPYEPSTETDNYCCECGRSCDCEDEL